MTYHKAAFTISLIHLLVGASLAGIEPNNVSTMHLLTQNLNRTVRQHGQCE